MTLKNSGKTWKLLYTCAPGLYKKCSLKPLPMILLEDGTLAQDYDQMRQRWQQHFADIELAEILPHDQITQAIRTARAQPNLMQKLCDLPSLFDTETLCLAMRATAAAGPDGIAPRLFTMLAPQVARLLAPLNFKIAATTTEPISFKESSQFELFKGSGSHSEVSNSRGVTCANAMSKPSNSFARKKLYSYTQHFMLDTQIGGRVGGGTDLASHIFRAFQQCCAINGISFLAFFFDLTAAFYRVLRALIVSRGELMSRYHGCSLSLT